jgi:hypothetical protein
MRRFGHLDNLEVASTPRQHLRYGLATVLALFGLGAVGWTVGTTIVELISIVNVISIASILRVALLGMGATMIAMWVRWRSRPRAIYALGITIIVVTIAVPVLRHFLA